MGKKIVISVTNDLVQDQRMHRVCNSLASNGYDVTFVGRLKKSSLNLVDEDYKQHRLNLFFSKGISFYLEYNVRLFIFLIRNRFDGYYSVDLDTILPMSIMSALKRKSHVHSAHEYFVEVPELQNKKFKKWIWNRVAYFCYKRCDKRITVNKELAKELERKYHQEFDIVRSVPYFNDEKRNSPQNDESYIILYQGVLNAGRGIGELIDTIDLLPSKFQLQIVGEGDLSDELRKKAEKSNSKDRILFLGWKTPKELNALTKSAWIGMNLLESTSLNYQYSLANKFFDYMHAGIPSINMNFPVYKRICKNNKMGLCVDDLDPETISKCILRLYEDKNCYDEMSRAALASKKEYCWENEEKVLIDIIKSVYS